ncbi:MAG: hypothetical protein KC493_12010 [Bacteriovoracaceae bacterium]|nr:hypothetical protein [Bacteriovoracaceae bacterium]
MRELFYNYMNIFFHPFSSHEELRRKRTDIDHGHVLSVVGGADIPKGRVILDESESGEITFAEALGVSWSFVIVKALYSLIFIHIGLHFFTYLSTHTELKRIIVPGFPIGSKKLTVFWLLLEVALFPLLVWLYVKFWSVIIRFFANLFETPNSEEGLRQVVNYSLSSHFFYLIPIFGELGKHVSSLFFLFAGLKKNLGFSNLQSLLVIVSPLIIFLIGGLMTFLSVMMVIGLF